MARRIHKSLQENNLEGNVPRDGSKLSHRRPGDIVAVVFAEKNAAWTEADARWMP